MLEEYTTMGTRLELQQKLQDLIKSNHVYFQPPESIKIQYPCIIYELEGDDVIFANDNPYKRVKQYQVTYIDKNPDSRIPDELALWQMCRFNRSYPADNLNHWVFFLYF